MQDEAGEYKNTQLHTLIWVPYNPPPPPPPHPQTCTPIPRWVIFRAAGWQRLHHGIKIRFKKKWTRIPIRPSHRHHSVQCTSIQTIGPPVEHVSKVDHKRPGQGLYIHPLTVEVDLEAGRTVGPEDGQHSVVTVCTTTINTLWGWGGDGVCCGWGVLRMGCCMIVA